LSVAAVNVTGQAEALGISLCDRRLRRYRLSYLEALEFGMLQIEWPSRIVAGARVRSAELLRFGPCLEGGLALLHCMGGIERMVFGLGPFEQMELDEPGNAIEMNHDSSTLSRKLLRPLFSHENDSWR
jgi:hypothetical protein